MTSPTPLSIVLGADDPLAGAEPVQWAVEELRAALAARGVDARAHDRLAEATGDPIILVAGGQSPAAREALAAAGVALPDVPEAFALLPATVGGGAPYWPAAATRAG